MLTSRTDWTSPPRRSRLIRIALLVATAFAALAAAGSRPAAPTARDGAPRGSTPAAPVKLVRAFYSTHSAGFRHEVLPETREIFTRLGGELDWLEVTVSDDIADLTPQVMSTLDVIVLYTSGTLPMSEAQKKAFMEFLERGGGVVGIHSASDTFHDWPWFVAMIGGEFDGHPWHEKVGIVLDDPRHPATRHLAEKQADGTTRDRFEITDEIYQFKQLNPERFTLMSLDTTSVTHDVDPARAYPLAWTRLAGKGRVFYTALGHRPEVWRDQRFIDHVLGGLRWAAGRE